MKKILGMFGAAMIVAGASGSAVACQSLEQIKHHWDDDTTGKSDLSKLDINGHSINYSYSKVLNEAIKAMVVSYFYQDDAAKNDVTKFEDLQVVNLNIITAPNSGVVTGCTFTIKAWYHAKYFYGESLQQFLTNDK